MTTQQPCQRWKRGRSMLAKAECIDPSAYEVAEIVSDRVARAFVTEHHYSGTYPAARFRFGLYHGERLVGVAVFSVPANYATLACLPGDPKDSIELGRFVLLDEVPQNGETWFLARCFEQLRDRVVGVVSFSDPQPRTREDGTVLFPGHVGTIYQAFNGVHLGRSKPKTLRLLADGTSLHARSIAKIRAQERGWERVASVLEQHGADLTGLEDAPRAWVAEWLPQVTRRVRHGGNHKYAWVVDRRYRKHLPPSLPYPKLTGLPLLDALAAS